MPVVEIASFAAFANLVVAGCRLAAAGTAVDAVKALADVATGAKSLDAALGTTGLAAVAAEMARTAEEYALHFTHPGRARDDAIALFWQVAPAAFADPATFAAAHLDPALTAERMVAAIRAGPLGRDFRQSVLAEPFFRGVAEGTLQVMLARADTVAALAPALWRQSLTTTAAIKDDTAEILALAREAEATGGRATTVVALDGGIAAGRDVNLQGATPAEVQALIAAATAPLATLNAAQQAEIVRLSVAAHAAGLTNERLLALAGRAGTVADVDQAFAALDQLVTVAIEVQARGEAGSNTGDFVDAVLARIARLSAENRDDEAAAEADRALAEWEERQRLETQKGIALLDAGLRADILRRNAASAASRIARKLELEPPDADAPFYALLSEQDAWYVRGRDQGLNFDLEVAIELARIAHALARDPGERGAVLHDLGTALARLGERESGKARLEEAVAAFRAALEERTRERVPLGWATTQMNLGTALARLGERESGTARLEEAVAAFRAALEEMTRDRVPLDWAMMQMNLGLALATLGARESGTTRLEEAVAAYRAALQEVTRDRVPLQWAMTQNNLGLALATLGERESGTARLEEAVVAYRAALEEWTRDRVPLDWAVTQTNLGNALRTLGEREGGTARLEEAVSACRAALEERSRERVPLDWAATQMTLGTALAILGERESGTARVEAAVAAYRAALEEMTRDRVPLQWAGMQVNLGSALAILGARESGTTRLEEAVAAYRAALQEVTRDRVPLQWAMTQNNLGNALAALGERESGTARLEEAVAAYRAALEERTRDRVPLDWASATGNQGAALLELAERTSDPAMAQRAHAQLVEGEAALRAGGHAPFADTVARQIPAAETLIARLQKS